MSSKGSSLRRTAIPQPSYDFLGGPSNDIKSNGNSNNGGDGSPPRALRQTFRQSSRPPPPLFGVGGSVTASADNEEMRAQLKSARYEIESLKQEREVTRIQHEKEVREAESRADAEFKRMQKSESKGRVATDRYDAAAREMRELQDRSTDAQRDLERRLRTAQDQAKELGEDAEEARAELAGAERQWTHRFRELEKKHDALQQTMREVRDELNMKTSNLDAAQKRLKKKEEETGALEDEVLQLRASGGDAEELATIRNQLTDQVEHIRKLEIANRDQGAELRNLRQAQKSAAIIEEEKRTLQLKLGKLDDVEKELDEAKYQRQLLEDEKKAWTAYFQTDDEASEFDSPEAMARAIRDERLEKASLLERLGAVQPDIVEKEGLIQNLEEEKGRLQAELSKLKSNSSGNGGTAGGSRALARLERQKNLALKEVDYLREQLKTFDSEDVTGEIRTDAEEESRSRVSQLEELLSQYRSELEMANVQLNSVEIPPPPQSPLKRPAPDSDGEAVSAQVGELSRKARKLQQEVADVQKEKSTLAADNSALKIQLSALQASAKTRVLSLRNNPTDDFEVRKFSTIELLRRENKALQAQLDGHVGSRRKGDVVPAESLEEAKLQIEEALAQVKSKEKLNERLKTVFAAKSQEMREAIASLLGWNVEFQPNGKFRLTSIFANEGWHGKAKDIERHITFHGEKGTMTIAGGPESQFGREIRGLIRFWVEERNEIPGFLAAYTLENLDRGREDDSS